MRRKENLRKPNKCWCWRCPICSATCRWPNTHHRALHYGGVHMAKQHDSIRAPILEKIKEAEVALELHR